MIQIDQKLTDDQYLKLVQAKDTASTQPQGADMPLVPMRALLDHAAENEYGIGAFNVNNMEQIQSIMEAARETDSPVIVQASRGAKLYSRHLPKTSYAGCN